MEAIRFSHNWAPSNDAALEATSEGLRAGELKDLTSDSGAGARLFGASGKTNVSMAHVSHVRDVARPCTCLWSHSKFRVESRRSSDKSRAFAGPCSRIQPRISLDHCLESLKMCSPTHPGSHNRYYLCR